MITRRGIITGLIGVISAPAIVRASSLMPVKTVWWPTPPSFYKANWVIAQHETMHAIVTEPRLWAFPVQLWNTPGGIDQMLKNRLTPINEEPDFNAWLETASHD